jgi:hypothetical protein
MLVGMTVTASRLREDIYNILDGILETGEPVEIERKGRVLRIVAEPLPGSILSRIKQRPGLINGDPEELIYIDWMKDRDPDANC